MFDTTETQNMESKLSHNMSGSSIPQSSDSTMNYDNLPRIEYELREHKLAITIQWTVIFLSSCVAPIVLYFALRYGAHLSLTTTLGVASAVFGVFAVFSLGKRTWALLKANSTCRPLGASKWAFDFFQINFMAAFVFITAIIVVGNVIDNIRIFALGLPILVTEVSLQMFLIGLGRTFNIRAPFRLSSTPAGDEIRSGVYIMAEDIVAVDAGQGQEFRQQLQDRYLASRTLQNLCWELDLLWGISGTVVGIGSIAALFTVPDVNVAFVLGEVLPWGYAIIMDTFTLFYCQYRLKTERADRKWIKQQKALGA